MTKLNSFFNLLIVAFLAVGISSCAAQSKSFTIKGGALVEAVYFNGTDASFAKKSVPALSKLVSENGGELLATFEVVHTTKSDRKISHISLVQWSNPANRDQVVAHPTHTKIEDKIANVAFFGAQADIPVQLEASKVYDFTSAWTVATDPCQMPVIQQVMGTYFGKITPALQKYQIAQTAFFGPHPAAPQNATKVFRPDMCGIFKWEKASDQAKFQVDPMFTEHVDIRDAVMKNMEIIMTKVVL